MIVVFIDVPLLYKWVAVFVYQEVAMMSLFAIFIYTVDCNHHNKNFTFTFRTDEEEKRDVRKYKKLSKQSSWKHKILTSLKRLVNSALYT